MSTSVGSTEMMTTLSSTAHHSVATTTTAQITTNASTLRPITEPVDISRIEVCGWWCASQAQDVPWSTLCTWIGCKGCSECDSSETTTTTTPSNQEPDPEPEPAILTSSVSPQTTIVSARPLHVSTTSEPIGPDDTVQPCESWCASQPQGVPWSSRCAWNGCKGCSECDHAMLMPTCQFWCASQSTPWSNRCTWDQCKGCSECDHAMSPLTCKFWCANQESEWSSRCTWNDCKGCSECSTVVSSPTCKFWCADHESPWSDRCAWDDCKDCSQCDPSRRRLRGA